MLEEQVPYLAQIATFTIYLTYSTSHNSILCSPALVFPFQGVGRNVGKRHYQERDLLIQKITIRGKTEGSMGGKEIMCAVLWNTNSVPNLVMEL